MRDSVGVGLVDMISVEVVGTPTATEQALS